MARQNKTFIPDSGRPTEFKPEYCGLLIEYGKTGDTMHKMCYELEIPADTFYQWVKSFPQFARAYKTNRIMCEHYYVNLAKESIEGKRKNFNSVAFIFCAKNLFNWSDKVESRSEHKEEITWKVQIGDDGDIFQEKVDTLEAPKRIGTNNQAIADVFDVPVADVVHGDTDELFNKMEHGVKPSKATDTPLHDIKPVSPEERDNIHTQTKTKAKEEIKKSEVKQKRPKSASEAQRMLKDF